MGLEGHFGQHNKYDSSQHATSDLNTILALKNLVVWAFYQYLANGKA